MPRTQEDRKAETRSRLLNAAAEQFAARGVGAVSVDTVASAAGRTSGAVYAHFGGKEGLLFALLSSWESEASDRIAAAIAEAELSKRPEALWRAFWQGDPSWMLLEHELWLYAARHPEAAGEVARRYRAGRKGMAEAFSQWAGSGAASPTLEAPELAVAVLALLLGLEMQRRVDPEAVTDETAAKALGLVLGLDPEPADEGATGAPDPRGER